jgi:hypothetical protein
MSGTGKVNNRLLLVGLVLLLAIPLALILKDVVREVILIPLWRVLWLASLVLHAIPQVFFWGALLMIILSLATKSLARQEKPVKKTRDVEPGYPGRVMIWAQRVHLMERGEYSRWYMAQRLRRLVLEVLAYHERLDIEQVRQRLKTGELDASPDVQACLQAELTSMSRLRGWFSRLWHRLRPSTRTAPPDFDLDRVVQFLEDQMNIEAQ